MSAAPPLQAVIVRVLTSPHPRHARVLASCPSCGRHHVADIPIGTNSGTITCSITRLELELVPACD